MDELDEMLAQLVPVVKPIVQAIEAMPLVTKDHYGAYMTAIAGIADMGDKNPKTYRNTCIAIGAAMERAGANKNGVTSALRAMGCL